MTLLTTSSAFSPLGDSTLGWSDSRERSADAGLALIVALVLLPLHGLVRWADRTSSRTSLKLAAVFGQPSARRRALQPGSTWTITRMARTLISRAAARPIDASRRAKHFFEFRYSPPESPGAGTVTDADEKRDSDQREPARDASRHHRGRPAR